MVIFVRRKQKCVQFNKFHCHSFRFISFIYDHPFSMYTRCMCMFVCVYTGLSPLSYMLFILFRFTWFVYVYIALHGTAPQQKKKCLLQLAVTLAEIAFA